jgi:deoxyribodipyrimidine photolyase-related protein
MTQPGSTVFGQALAAQQPGGVWPARWVWVPEDQLTAEIGPLVGADPAAVGVVIVEHHGKARVRPYHRQRLAMVWSNQRHFALELAGRGFAVRYLTAPGRLAEVLGAAADELGPLLAMTPAEHETRADIASLVERGRVRLVPHAGWMTNLDDFRRSQGKRTPWRMDAFYRFVRSKTGVLMEGPGKDRFVGGKLSFDAENRERWDGIPAAASPPRFEPDEITREVGEMVEREFAEHPGELDLGTIPATARDAEAAWVWAKRACLPHFGPFEDAMSVRSTTIFHTRLSGLINLHRLLPARVVREAEALDIPLASKEGFIRQILGWREFVKHVHDETRGFRDLPGGRAPVASAPGDAGFARWAGRRWPGEGGWAPDGGASPRVLGGDTPLPPAYWGAPSGMNCLDTVVKSVWDEAWSHHITRLMVLSNIATLLDVSPRELTDWFWVAYLDAWDWVVEPNVLGMGTYAAGPLMTTKPYVAGSAYIDKMSDYCEGCQLNPKTTCPLPRLYWAFLDRHQRALKGNPRLTMPLASLGKRTPEQKREDARTFVRVRDLLVNGRAIG